MRPVRRGARSTKRRREPVTESYEALQNLIAWLLHGEPWETRQIPKTLAAAGAWLQGKAELVVPDAIDRGKEPFIRPFMVRLADEHYELDTSRAEALLGWRPEHSLRRSLQTIIGRLRSDPAAWYQQNKIPLPLWLEGAQEAAQPAARLIAEYNGLDRVQHHGTLWCHFANIGLGLWLVASPFVFGLAQWMQEGELIAPNSRGLVYSATWMAISEIITGALVVLFGLLSLSRDAGWARWITAALGLWLLYAPILLWTASPAAYANDTLVGALLIVFAVALPSAPGINPLARVSGPDAPRAGTTARRHGPTACRSLFSPLSGCSSRAIWPRSNWVISMRHGIRSSARARNASLPRRYPRLGRFPMRAWAPRSMPLKS